jgi:hypothetical protein
VVQLNALVHWDIVKSLDIEALHFDLRIVC